jgi:two-component system response regulator FixJ
MLNGPRVHIVDDDDAIRDSVAALLCGAGFACETYHSAADFLDRASADAGCALIDVRMPGMDGIALLNELRSRGSALAVIVMTGFADVPLAVQAMKLGAVDFVEKPAPRDVLIAAVHRALEQAKAGGGSQDKAAAQARLERLTERERDVLVLLVGGDANKVVAHKLGISPRTVEIHRSRLMEKTQSGSLAELVRLAIAAGIAASGA